MPFFGVADKIPESIVIPGKSEMNTTCSSRHPKK